MKKISHLTFFALALSILFLIFYQKYRVDTKNGESPVKRDLENSVINTESVDSDSRPNKLQWNPSDNEINSWKSTEAIFYGKVINLEGSPVQNADVYCSIFTGNNVEDERKIVLKTNEDGTFKVHEKNAPSIRIAVSAVGYYRTDQSSYNFEFSEPLASMPKDLVLNRKPKTVSSSERPTIFKLRKMNSREPLVYRKINKTLTEQQSYLIGEKKECSISVKYWLDPKGNTKHSHGWPLYPWGIEISVDNGGILQANATNIQDPESFLAPIENYKPSFKFVFEGKEVEGIDGRSLRSEFFVKFHDGTYARLDTSFEPDPKRPLIHIKSWYNPSGSRATEPDPTRYIEPKE